MADFPGGSAKAKPCTVAAGSEATAGSRRLAVLAGTAECWICVAGVWLTGVVRSLVGDAATVVTAVGLMIVTIADIAFEQPCRWPV